MNFGVFRFSSFIGSSLGTCMLVVQHNRTYLSLADAHLLW